MLETKQIHDMCTISNIRGVCQCQGEWKMVYEDVACEKKRQNTSTKQKDCVGAERASRK